MATLVPKDDLPDNIVPVDDLPGEASFGNRLLASGVKGMMSGGLIPSVIGMSGEVLNTANNMLSAGAYKAGGAVTDFAASSGAPAPLAAGLGTAANVGLQAIPALVGAPAGKLLTPAIKGLGERFMQSAVKPGIAARTSGDWAKARAIMFDKDINATQGAMEAMKAKVTDLEVAIQSILENSPGVVNKAKVAKAAETAMGDVKLNLNVVDNLADIDKAVQKFINHPALQQYGNDIPVAVANRMKQAFYKELKSRAYVPGQALSAEDKAQKSMAAGLRSEVGAAEPAVVPNLNEQSDLLKVLKVVGPQIGREGNKNIIGLGILSPTMERTFLWMLDRYPWFKSTVARGLYSNAESIPQAAVGAGIFAGNNSFNQNAR